MRISQRGQITIPKALRERFGMDHNVEVEITPTEQGLLIRKAKNGERPVNGTSAARDKDAADPPDGETQAERIHRILDERAGMHPVDRVSGILDHLDFDVDEYIEEIRGR
jgi:AbrB family looped-hinge helix DNA binding protein